MKGTDIPPVKKDTGLQCLIMIARFHQLGADQQQIKHQFGQDDHAFSDLEILRAAKAIDLKAKQVISHYNKLDNASLPAIAKAKDGGYFVIARIDQKNEHRNPSDKNDEQKPSDESKTNNTVLIQQIEQHSETTPPQIISPEKLEQMWSGELILLKRQGSLFSSKKFDISWFIPSLVKYFKEVLVVSFFLQLFALVTPLFFQVVMDKVLVHKGLTTLDVLALGFFVIAIFDMILGGLRNYIFAHTANRVDVELGAKLFHHLLSLPLGWFESRQVGQSVARVRELDSIRNFITGTALTLLIDLSFTVIFFAVMWFYSSTLTLIVLGTIPFYIILSIVITPILRQRLDQKFKYGAENQSFLVESVTGVETLKTMAVEPQMQRKWEEQLAKYINASFSSQNLNNVANQIAGFISKMTTLLIVWFGAHLVMSGDLSVGQLIAFNMMAGRVSGPILKLVQLWQDFQQAGNGTIGFIDDYLMQIKKQSK
ncbi:MAG: type I secretion system permease/ATPase, partial [Gammaproteobacteria bacterium]|nr:type I secretion system permease/ATPase [Gammaproteobacteria bacterium]